MLAQHLLHVRLVMHVKATLFSQVEFVSPLKDTLLELGASLGLSELTIRVVIVHGYDQTPYSE